MTKDYLVDWDSYGVTPCGIVYSKNRYQTINNRHGTKTTRLLKGRVLKPWVDSGGKYLYISLGSENKISVHKLVALAYLPNPNNLLCVHHKDFNTKNNKVTNLEWVSHSDNMKYNAAEGRIVGPYGKQKLVPSDRLDKELRDEYERVGSFSKMDGFMDCSRSSIVRYFKKRGLNV